MSTAKPAQMTLPALRAHCKALEDCLARANKELRAAKKDLKHRNEQVTFHADHARKNAEDAQATREALRSVLSALSAGTEDYAQALAAMRLAERELAQRRAAYVEYIGELADVVQSEEVKP